MSVLLGPSAKQLEVILSELNETEDRLNSNVRDLIAWCTSQPHMPDITDAQLLRVFLRGCRHDMVRTRAKLECFCRARADSVDLYEQRQMTCRAMQNVTSYMDVVSLPRLTEEGYRVTVFRLKPDCDDVIFSVPDMVKYVFLLVDARMHDESALAGDVFVWDLGGARAAIAARIASSAGTLRRALHLAHAAYPQRLKRVHILNAPTFLASSVNLLRSFMKEKIRSRFVLHSSKSSLLEHISRDVLPKDYGGNEAELGVLIKRWNRRVAELQSYLDSLHYLRVQGERPAVSGLAKESYMFGTEGAFRSLNID